MIRLRLVQRPQGPPDEPVSWPVPAGGLVIGRAPDCDIVLPDLLRVVSRQHARVELDERGARLHCLSNHSPLLLNDRTLAAPASAPLAAGDRLALGGFELRVELLDERQDPVPADTVAALTPKSRLDAWFDLSDDNPALTPAPVLLPATPANVPSTAPPARSDVPAPAAAEAPRAPIDTLTQAFLQGAGLTASTTTMALTPETMHRLGELLRVAVEGTLALLQSRATVKDGLGIEGTRIAQVQNNPLKFAPDATAALQHLLAAQPARGYLAPVAALRDAQRDLLIHHLAVMAGMRASVLELFDRLGPDAVVHDHGAPPAWSAWLPALHEAALWRHLQQHHAQLRARLDDDFETVFGRQFRRAYEAQSRLDDPATGGG